MERVIDKLFDKIVSFISNDELREDIYSEVLEYCYSRDISDILYSYNVSLKDRIVRYIVVNIWNMLRVLKVSVN